MQLVSLELGAGRAPSLCACAGHAWPVPLGHATQKHF